MKIQKFQVSIRKKTLYETETSNIQLKYQFLLRHEHKNQDQYHTNNNNPKHTDITRLKASSTFSDSNRQFHCFGREKVTTKENYRFQNPCSQMIEFADSGSFPIMTGKQTLYFQDYFSSKISNVLLNKPGDKTISESVPKTKFELGSAHCDRFASTLEKLSDSRCS